MEPDFDPYRKWLGIPPQDQPPNHYRLLGLELFEIATAADGRMAQLKRFQTGKYSAYSQRLLNEIAKARVCLLNAQQKAEYDDQLRKHLAETQQAHAQGGAAGPRKPPPRRIPTATSGAIGLPSASVASYLAARRRSTRPWLILAAAGAAGALVLGLIVWIWAAVSPGSLAQRPDQRPPGSATSSETTGPETIPQGTSGEQLAPHPPGAGTPSTTPAPPDEAEQAVTPPESVPQVPGLPAEPQPGESGSGSTETGTIESPSSGDEDSAPQSSGEALAKPLEQLIDPESSAQTQQGSMPGESGTTPGEGEADENQKLPAPDAQALGIAEQQIREVFGRDLAAAHTPDKKRELAELLFQQGREVFKQPEIRFVAVQLAGRLAAEAGELELALSTADWLGERYQLSVPERKAELLEEVFRASGAQAEAAEKAEQVFRSALALAGTAAAEDDYEAADRLVRVAVMAARRIRDPARLREVSVFERELDRGRSRFRAFQNALELLAEDPDNAEANLTVGRWYCFQKGQWEKGLPYLSRGSDAALAKVAQQELAGAATPAELVGLADQWSKLAHSASGRDRQTMLGRAIRCYEQALPLLQGLEQVRVEKELRGLRLAQEAITKTSEAVPGGVVVDGNVALASRGTVIQGPGKKYAVLIDGNATRYNSSDAYSAGKPPCVWTITFPRVYRLQVIRFLFFDLDRKRYYRYKVEVSPDGQNFTLLADRSQGQWRGWQMLSFPPRPVKAVRLHGLYASHGEYVLVVEFEAYCRYPSEQ